MGSWPVGSSHSFTPKRVDDAIWPPPEPIVHPVERAAASPEPVIASPFEQTHRALDTLVVIYLWLHVPLVACIGLMSGRHAMLAGVAVVIAGAATFMRLIAHGAFATRLTMAAAFIGMVSTLLAAVSGNAWQVDLHMYYFVAMAVLATYCDAGVILTAAAFTALHHLILNFLMPALVFPGGPDLGRVLLHAALIVLEAGALVWMTRRVATALALSSAALCQSQADRTALQAKTARAEMLLQNNLHLRVLSDTDGLTGIGNRRFFDTKLDSVWADCARDAAPVGLLLMDIDHFKTFNDRYGHQVGDRCLRLVADALSTMTRQNVDFLARFGGEEFALILPHAPLMRVQAAGERLRRGVEGLLVPLDSGTCRVNISVGCASVTPVDGMAPAALIAAADAELYCAKDAGRNCIHPPTATGEEKVT